jgi:hypothetical protein
VSGPAISFIVPAYNASATLGQTVRSILAQTVADLEVVVIDDGSDDDPRSTVRDLGDARINIRRQANRGLAGARNAGLAIARGSHVCFVDADDLVLPRFAETMLARVRSADLAACAYRMIGERGEDLRWVVRPADHDLSAARLAAGNPLAVGGVVLRRETADRFAPGGQLFDESLRVVEDWDLWVRLSAGGVVWAPVEPEPLFLCRLRAGSLSRGVERMWRTGLIVLGRAGAGPEGVRRWHLRTLAHAVATAEEGLIHLVFSEVGDIRKADLGTLIGALREAFCRQHRVGPEDAWVHQLRWREQIARLFPDRAWGRPIAELVSWEPDRWDAVARAAAARVCPSETLVIYGAGQNGRAVLEALDRLGVPCLVMDDHPDAARGRARVALGELTRRHVVLVTPEERQSIVACLSGSGAGRVLLPEDLLAGVCQRAEAQASAQSISSVAPAGP